MSYQFLLDIYGRLIARVYEQGEITLEMQQFMTGNQPADLDELDTCFKELAQAVECKQYYQLLARIEKAEKVIDAETDMTKRRFYVKKMRELVDQLEKVRPA